MADYDNRVVRGAGADVSVVDAGLRAHMLRIYNYMLVGLVLTGATAWLTANTQLSALFFHVNAATNTVGLTGLGWLALFAPLGLVLLMSFGISRMSVGAAQATFWVYSGLVGIGLAPILWVYTGASIAETFFVTAATFGAMSLWGYTTRSDLSGMGSFLFMGLIGIVIASVVNLFMQSQAIQWVVSVLGVLIFTGLTAWDTQWIKEMYVANDDGTMAGHKAIIGALKLYLDFLNLFLFLLRFLGTQRR
ncbi:MAG TPA: Bax inhibitor-1/YccA family protein [Rhizomicrobium sp.]|nr:Bax inhibitor-1/YccA family protein [Rhizomicrobium sp.]